MKCPSEFILSRYADGELPKGEAAELLAHLADCAACRKQTEALRAENQLLSQSLQSIDLIELAEESLPLKAPVSKGTSRIAAVFFGAAVLMRLGYGLLNHLEPPAAMEWLIPFSLSGLLTWLANAIFFIISEGSSKMTTLVNGVGFALLSLMILSGLLAMTRRLKKATAMIGVLASMAIFVLPGYSMEFRKAEQNRPNITVSAGETIDDTLVAAGDSVIIKGIVSGDLIAFGRKVNIQGTVRGNVIGFAQRIDISGTVEGDVFNFGQSIDVKGHIARNLWAFGQTVAVGIGGKVDQNAVIFGSDISMDGDVGRDLAAYAGFLDAGGVVGRDVRFGGERLTLSSSSKIGGNLEATVKLARNVVIEAGASIAGNRKVKLVEPQRSKYLTLGFYLRQLLRLGAALLAGLILFWLVPAVGRVPLAKGRTLLASGGIGFLAAIAIPVAAIIIGITLIGLPIALVAMVLWLLGLYLAKIIVAKCIGGLIFGKNGNGIISTALSLLVGLVIVIIAVNLPYIGGVLNFLLILIGLGAFMIALYQMWQLRRNPASTAA